MLKHKMVLVILVLMSMFGFAKADITKLNSKQLDNLRFACDFGKEAIWRGDDLCYTFAAITWVETRAGMDIVGGKGHMSFGLFQNYVGTVSRRIKQEGSFLPEKEIKNMLMNREASAYWAKVELFDWLKYHRGNMRHALASYNAGYNYKKSLKYADDVLQARSYFIRNNDRLKIRN